jgi:iron complex transport system permease protein
VSVSDYTGSGAGRLALLLTLSLLILGIAVAFATAIGDYAIGLRTVVLAVTNGLGLTGAEIPPIEQSVVWDLRLSRAFIAALAGAGLAICGAVLQALLRNALAEPFVLGVSAGASTGAVAVIVLGVGAGGLSLSMGAFAGAFAARTGSALIEWCDEWTEPHHTRRCRRLAAFQRANFLHSHHIRQCAAGARCDVLAARQLRRRALA